MAKSRVAACKIRRTVLARRSGANADQVFAEFAWEFLRRNPAYRADFEAITAGRLSSLPDHWGLLAAIDPDALDVDVRAIWRHPDSSDEGILLERRTAVRECAKLTRQIAEESSASSLRASARR